MKYVKKRIPIEAYQTKAEMYIETLEGTMHASVGDYIITGVNGERYPCKPDIFEKTYEPYEEDAVSRKMAMDAITASTPCCVVPDDYHISVVDMEFRISTLPSVTPKRKTGKWNFIGNQMFECSECGTCYTQSQFYQMRVRISDTEFPKFCPNCGAKMGGEQDG